MDNAFDAALQELLSTVPFATDRRPTVAPVPRPTPNDTRLFNISTRKIGGLRYLKIGRFCFSFCITREYRSL